MKIVLDEKEYKDMVQYKTKLDELKADLRGVIKKEYNNSFKISKIIIDMNKLLGVFIFSDEERQYLKNHTTIKW